MNHHLRFPPGNGRVEAAVVGAGAFGRSFLAQGRRMALMGARIAVDRDAATAAAGLAAANVPREDIALCVTSSESRAETLGLEVIAAGKSSEYDFVSDPSVGRVSSEADTADVPRLGAVWDLPAGDVGPALAERTRMVGLPTRAVPDPCEMGLVAAATALCPDTPAFHAPIVRVGEVPTVFDTAAEGGILAGTGRLDVFNCLRLPHEVSFAGGVFVTMRCTDPATWRVLEAEGHILSRSGRAELVPAASVGGGRALPFYLLPNRALARSVRQGNAIIFADCTFGPDDALLRMRQAQDAMAGGVA